MEDRNTVTCREMASLMKDLTNIMSSSQEETEHLMRVKVLLEQWTSLFVDVREKNILENVKELTAQLKEKKQEEVKEQKSAEKDVDKIQNEIDSMKSACSKTDQMTAKLEEDYKELKQQQQQILLSQEQLADGSDDIRKKYKPMLDLVMYVSNIRYQSGDGESADTSAIKGYVVNKSNVQPFDLSKDEHSDFYISNYLWSLMEADW